MIEQSRRGPAIETGLVTGWDLVTEDNGVFLFCSDAAIIKKQEVSLSNFVSVFVGFLFMLSGEKGVLSMNCWTKLEFIKNQTELKFEIYIRPLSSTMSLVVGYTPYHPRKVFFSFFSIFNVDVQHLWFSCMTFKIIVKSCWN